MAAVPKSLRALVVMLAIVMGRASSAPTQPAHDASPLRAPLSGVGAELARPVAAPHRVISLVPATTEMLFAMGAGSVVVGVTSYDAYPPEVATLPKLGGLLDPNVERLLALKPDLVIVYNTQAELKQQLERAGIPMFPYVHRDLADVTATIRALGERVGFGAQANTLAGGMERKLGEIRSRVAGRPRPRTLLVFGRQQGTLQNIDASGGYGFLHDMLEAAGGDDAAGDIKRESVQMTTEMVLARAPDVIVEMHYSASLTPAQMEAEKHVWDTLGSVPAVRTHRVYLVLGDEYVVPGPRLVSATERLARLLHPDAFK